MARCAGVPLRALLGGERGLATRALETDITIAIAEPRRMAELAREWTGRGFRALKIKVGKDVDADVRALEAIARAAPGARLRVDANAGYTPRQAHRRGPRLRSARLRRRHRVLGAALRGRRSRRHARSGRRSPRRRRGRRVGEDADDLRELVASRYAGAVNLKIAKLGGVLVAVRMGREAQAAGLAVMAGGMVETRLGMTAAAHMACALGGVDFVDLDTAWLLADDPYAGGYEATGPRYAMPDTPGLGVARAIAQRW